MSLDPLPFFPPELELEIFETTAELYPQTIPSLFLVSWRVYDWIERIKYRTVTPTAKQLCCPLWAFQRAIRSNSKPPRFFHNHVRHLLVEDDQEDVLIEILSACSGIQTLALFISKMPPSLLPKLVVMRPRKLSIDLQTLQPVWKI
ncbi:hypothetical protein B0H19DRAFT_163015 [Mycena capillaripes]|nr:hypothetical protein B0H19DRAFT_163015 [Mycena capillaripes]